MILSVPHKICENVWALGNRAFPSFLLRTPNGLYILEPELSCNLSLIEKQLKTIGFSLKEIDGCIVLHEHYDHVMMVPGLKALNPEIEIFVPLKSERFLQKESLLAYRLFDEFTCEKLNLPAAETETNMGFNTYDESTHIDGIEFIHTPGHSPFSYTALFNGTAFVSDAAGFWGEKLKFPLYFQSFERYIESIEKIAKIRPHTVITGHFSYFSKDEADKMLKESIKMAEQLKKRLEGKTLDEETVKTLYREIYRDEFLLYPEEVIKSVARYIIKRSVEV